MKHIFTLMLINTMVFYAMTYQREGIDPFLVKKAKRFLKVNMQLPYSVKQATQLVKKVEKDLNWFEETFKNVFSGAELDAELNDIRWALYWRVENAKTWWCESIVKDAIDQIAVMNASNKDLFKTPRLRFVPIKNS